MTSREGTIEHHLKRRVFMPGYVRLEDEQALRSLTGGILYDHRVALRFRSEGFSVNCFDLDTLPRFAKLLKFPVAKYLRNVSGDFDVLVSDLGNSALTAGFQAWARKHGRLTVLICHHFRSSLEPSFPRRLMYRISEKRVVAAASVLVANSPHTSSVLRSMGREDGEIVPAPPGLSVPVVTEPVLRQEPSRILSVCSVEARKGVLEMVRALHASKLPGIRLVIAGDPRTGTAYRREVDGLISELGMGSRIVLLGRLSREELVQEYHSADAFMLLSNWEGYGMAIAEAMASGLPVIATAAGAIPELVRDGENGLLAEPGDWRSAAGHIRRLFTDEDLRGRIASSALESAAGLPSWEETTGRVLEAVERRLSDT